MSGEESETFLVDRRALQGPQPQGLGRPRWLLLLPSPYGDPHFLGPGMTRWGRYPPYISLGKVGHDLADPPPPFSGSTTPSEFTHTLPSSCAPGNCLVFPRGGLRAFVPFGCRDSKQKEGICFPSQSPAGRNQTGLPVSGVILAPDPGTGLLSTCFKSHRRLGFWVAP